LEIGVCFGSFTEKGWLVRAKNERCPLKNDELLSMMEYSAVLYQHGEFERLYGPFPQTSYSSNPDYYWNFVSFSFLIQDQMVHDSRLKRLGGKTPALMLIIYPKQHDTVFILCKESIVKFLTNVIRDQQSVIDIDSQKLSKISRNIGDLVSTKLSELEKPTKILSPSAIFNLPKATHPTVLAMIHIQIGTLAEISQETEFDLHTTEEHLQLLIETGYVKMKDLEGKQYYFCLSE
jgi:hypothetical protein